MSHPNAASLTCPKGHGRGAQHGKHKRGGLLSDLFD